MLGKHKHNSSLTATCKHQEGKPWLNVFMICIPAVLATLAGGGGAGLTSPGLSFQEPLALDISDDITAAMN